MSARIRTLWIASELYYPEESATGYVLTRLAEALAAYGTVHVLCTKPNGEHEGRPVPARERVNGVEIVRVPVPSVDPQHLGDRAVRSIIVALRMFLTALMKFRNGDIVMVVTNPPTLPFLVAVAARLRNVTFILLMHDVYPDAAIMAGAIRAGGAVACIWGWLGDLLLRNADRVIVLGRDMMNLVAQRAPETESRTRLIPNWADTELIRPQLPAQNHLLLRLGLTGHFVLGYAGTIGRVQDIEMLMRAAEILRKSAPDVHFLFSGSGVKANLVRESAERLGNITLLGSKRRCEQNEFLNGCHVSIMALVRGMAGVGVPSRLYNALAAGKPVLAAVDPASEPALVIDEMKVGKHTPSGCEAEFVDAVLLLRSDQQYCTDAGVRARAAAEEQYSFAAAEIRYLALFREFDWGLRDA